jgi:tetratricopeptide (TPR) repeat protein
MHYRQWYNRLGRVQTDLLNYVEAEAAFLQLLGSTPGQHFASVEAGLRGYLGRHGLAVVYHRQGRHEQALAQWRLVQKERPDFLPGWLGLGENALARRDVAALEEVARKLEGLEGSAAEAGILRSRWQLIQKEVAAARALAEGVVAQHPEHIGAKLYLASLLLNEARDLPAAEAVLRQALLLAPNNAEVQRALAALLRQKVQTETAVFVAQGDLTAWALGERYQAACVLPSDINEHLPTLHELARDCRHITGVGTQAGTATLALLAAQPRRLVCYDLVRFPQVDQLAALAGQTEFVFRQGDVLRADIEETDLLLLDSVHAYEPLKEELRRHAARARRYIVLHDTTTFGERGEAEGQRGLWPAVEEFLAEGTFRLKQRFTNNNGLTVLERTGADLAGEERREP